jgi:hypothetical protein
MSLLENLAIKEVGAVCGESYESAKDHIVSLYNKVEATIRGSESVLSDDERDRVIREEMESQATIAEGFPDTYKWLKECFLGRTL